MNWLARREALQSCREALTSFERSTQERIFPHPWESDFQHLTGMLCQLLAILDALNEQVAEHGYSE